jgi:hypothetical protein
MQQKNDEIWSGEQQTELRVHAGTASAYFTIILLFL